jgi:DNA polymerase III subunit gamma/tau
LTERVKLISFPGQSIRTEGSSISKNKNVQVQKSIIPPVEKPQPKISSNPIGTVDSELLSINLLLQKSKEKNVIESTYSTASKPTTPFTIDQVKMSWKQFAFKMKEEGNDTIYLAMSKRDPKIVNETEIHQEFDNQVQVDRMQNHVMDLLDFLRNNLQNWSTQVFFDVSQHLDENKKLLTGKDKFNELAKKNGNLFSLQKTFNLDVDY